MEIQDKISNPEDDSHLVERSFKNPIFLLFINDLPIVSFLIAHLFLIIIFSAFWNLSIVPLTIVIFSGMLLSFFIIKPNYALNIDQTIIRLKESLQFASNFEEIQKFVRPKITIGEIFTYISRNLFFNFFNDLFVLLIFWFVFYFFMIFAHFVTLPTESNLTLFAELIGLIGIISGLFQFYITYYKEKSQKIFRSLVEEQLETLKEISFKDFRQFLIHKKKDSLVEKIDRIYKGTPRYIQTDVNTRFLREYYINNISYSMKSPMGLADIQLFTYFENYALITPDFDRRDLFFQYKSYLNEKISKFKEQKIETIETIRSVMFSSINFSDEVLASYFDYRTKMAKKIEDPETFNDLFSNFTKEYVMIFFDKILEDIP